MPCGFLAMFSFKVLRVVVMKGTEIEQKDELIVLKYKYVPTKSTTCKFKIKKPMTLTTCEIAIAFSMGRTSISSNFLQPF